MNSSLICNFSAVPIFVEAMHCFRNLHSNQRLLFNTCRLPQGNLCIHHFNNSPYTNNILMTDKHIFFSMCYHWIFIRTLYTCHDDPKLGLNDTNAGKISVILAQLGTVRAYEQKRTGNFHDNVMIWIRLPHDWLFGRGIHQALMFPLLLAWTGCWTNSQVANDLKCHAGHVSGLVQERRNSIANALELRLSGLVQERRNSIANTLELRLSYTNPLTWCQCNAMI